MILTFRAYAVILAAFSILNQAFGPFDPIQGAPRDDVGSMVAGVLAGAFLWSYTVWGRENLQ